LNVKEIIEKEKTKATLKVNEANAGFKKGQKVEVIFPGVQMPKKMIGILATNEFEDEEGGICAIFTPIEGEQLTEFAFKMPENCSC